MTPEQKRIAWGYVVGALVGFMFSCSVFLVALQCSA